MDKRKQQLIAALVLFAIAVVLSYFSVEEKKVGSGSGEADVMLVIDVSGSMSGDKLEDAKNAASEFLNTLDTSHRVGLISFSGNAQLMSHLTDDRNALVQSVNQLNTIGSTAMGDGMVLGANTLSTEGEGNRTLCMVLMTDGHHNAGRSSPDEGLRKLKSKGIITYTVGFGIGADAPLLQKIATETGGRYLYAASGTQLSNAFVGIANIINRNPVYYYGSRGLMILALVLIIFLPEFKKGIVAVKDGIEEISIKVKGG